MKTRLKLSHCLIAVLTIISTSCKEKAATGTASDLKRNSMIDSLKITDPTEIKVCTGLDEISSEYLTGIDSLMKDSTKLIPGFPDPRARYEKKMALLKPEVDKLLSEQDPDYIDKYRKYQKFYDYEVARVLPVVLKYMDKTKRR